jgi:hypothetical protein
MKKGLLILVLTGFCINLSGQESRQTWASENISFNGYIKYMNTTIFQDFDATLNDNLLHNRLNFKTYLNKFSATVEMRNRLVWGNTVNLYPDYASLLDVNNEDIDLSFFSIERKGLIMLSEIDRLNVTFSTDKWQIIAGRQRINWGKNLAWNPNDIFNTYSFFDFDYEERPGTDALRIQYFTSGNSSIESAVNYKKDWKESTLALKYNFHAYNYDIQLLAAKYIQDYMMGLGWEGAVKNLGIKGELSYFVPREKDEEDAFVSSIALDYYFKNGISINASGLYNSIGVSSASEVDLTQFSQFLLSPKMLMPNKWSFFMQSSKSFTPALNGSFSVIYAKELKGLFMMPVISYSIAQNWDFDTTGQIFYGKQNDKLSNISNSVYLRFRYSF